MATQILRVFLLLIEINLVILQKPGQNDHNNPSYYNIGGVLNNNESEIYFHDTIAVSDPLRMSTVKERASNDRKFPISVFAAFEF